MKEYYRSIEERDRVDNPVSTNLENEVLQKQEILEFLEKDGDGVSASRRDFLKFLGFSFATAAVVSSCKNPVNKAIPYLIKPEDVYPGEASHYASTYFDGKDFSNIVVKVRDGRPVKLEGNEKCPVTAGGSTARIQASLLNLYDEGSRLHNPLKSGNQTNWETADKEIKAQLKSISSSGGKTVLLSSSIISPSLLKAVQSLLARYPGMEHIMYDPISAYGLREAHRRFTGQDVIPAIHFEKAEVIVGINCDFLGTWISPVEFSRNYALTRRLNKEKSSLSHHIQYETALSITGSAADRRIPIKPSQEGMLLLDLYTEISRLAGKKTVRPASTDETLSQLAGELWQNRSKSLVVAGSNDVNLQLIVCVINDLLENYGQTLTLGDGYQHYKGDDSAMNELVSRLKAGKIEGLILYGVNPAFSYPDISSFTTGMGKLKLSVSTSSVMDESAKLCQYVCPDSHYLESWSDAEFRKNIFSLGQPVINKLFNTRSFLESVLIWSEMPADPYDHIQQHWKNSIYPLQKNITSFQDFWNQTLQTGVLDLSSPAALFTPDITLAETAASRVKPGTPARVEVILYESIAMGNGMFANNPWLQELPDPVSKVTWDNYAAIAPETARQWGLKQGSIISLMPGLEIPVLIQPGQAPETLGIALGYGRTDAGKAGNGVGTNAYPLVNMAGDSFIYHCGIQYTLSAGEHSFAQTQLFHSMEGRALVRESNLGEYLKNPSAGNEEHARHIGKQETLYPDIEMPLHNWAMAIDLNACTGCSSCVIGCQAENNIPVTGKAEVARKHSMHWIRIDRYYSGDSANPDVLFQPVMCQHCDNAPCENVCPVAATTHSTEGLNQMAYNRCVGTKYCINNCPYKVRRFNWFRYTDNPVFGYGSDTALGKMVYNPDVVVRERGVVEKCSFCIQRIQAGKLAAKLEGRAVQDKDIQTACMQACPSHAIVFGDLNDPESEVSRLFKNPRNYNLLEELHTLPSIGYLTKIRNTENNV